METKISLKELKAFAIAQREIWKTLSNKNRIEILYELYKGKSTWSELMFNLKINPKSLNNHLKYLIRLKMVEKTIGFYKITDFGKEVCELKIFEDIKSS
jgi:DNA-binding HxlR family transcriptional regulator